MLLGHRVRHLKPDAFSANDLQFRTRTVEPYRGRRNRCLTMRLRGKNDLS